MRKYEEEGETGAATLAGLEGAKVLKSIDGLATHFNTARVDQDAKR